jgi:hypothetical protein
MAQSDSIEELLLPSPNVLGLPALDKGERAESATRKLVTAEWPFVEALVMERRLTEAIEAMAALASEMRRLTRNDPEPWRETLLLSRFILYDNIMSLAGSKEWVEPVQKTLSRAREWDIEARDYLAELLGRWERQNGGSANT